MPSGVTWRPKNLHDRYDGWTTLAHAFAFSRNDAFIRLSIDVTPEAIINVARRFGITTNLKPTPMIALGTDNFKPIDITRTMGTIANDGVEKKTWFIRRVFSRTGRLLYEHHVEPGIRRMDSVTTVKMRSAMSLTVDSGTARVIRDVGAVGPIGGKTGTTSRATDLWFCGYATDVAMAVWFGAEKPKPLGDEATGGRFAAAAAGEFLRDRDSRLKVASRAAGELSVRR